MAKKRAAETLFFVFFLDYWQGSHTEFSSSSKNMDEGLAKIFDEILLQVFSKVPFDETRTAGKSITKRDVKESYPQKKSLKNTDFGSSSSKREEHLSKLFDEILQQVFYKVPSGTPLDEARTAGESITKRDMDSEIFIKGAGIAGYSTPPRFPFGSMDRISTYVEMRFGNGWYLAKLGNCAYFVSPKKILQMIKITTHTDDHNSEKRDRESSLSNRDMNEPLAAVGKETPEAAARTGIQDKNVPCEQLLQFLQRNIIIAAASVAGVLVVTVLLLLALTACYRRKQLSHSPANTTYNIFILNGKTWWQKFQEKNPKKHSVKQKQLLKGKSRV